MTIRRYSSPLDDSSFWLVVAAITLGTVCFCAMTAYIVGLVIFS